MNTTEFAAAKQTRATGAGLAARLASGLTVAVASALVGLRSAGPSARRPFRKSFDKMCTRKSGTATASGYVWIMGTMISTPVAEHH